MAREQVQGPRLADQLQPERQVLNSFVPVSRQRAQKTDAERLASALAQVDRGAQVYIEAKRQEMEKQAQQEAEGRLAGLTFDEAKKLHEAGELAESDNPFYLAALQKGFGAKMARNQRDQWLASLEDDAFVLGNPEAQIAEGIEQTLAGITDNFVRSGYTSEIADARERVLGAVTTERSRRARKQALDNTFDSFLSAYDKARADGATVEQAGQLIRSEYPNVTELFGVSGADLDAEVYRVADVLASRGDYEGAKHLLYDDRGGIGAIGRKREFAQKAEALLDRAENVRHENLREENINLVVDVYRSAERGTLTQATLDQIREQAPGLIEDEEYRRLIISSEAERERQVKAANDLAKKEHALKTHYESVRQAEATALVAMLEGRAYAVEDIEVPTKTGKAVETLTRDEAISSAMDTYMRVMSPKIAEESGETPEQVLRREVEMLSKNNLVYDPHKRLVEQAAAGISNIDYATGEVPEAVVAGFELYRQTRAVHPRYSAQLASGGDLDFLETASILTDYAGWDTDKALLLAAQSVDPRTEETPLMRQKLSELTSIANSASGTGSWFTGQEDIENFSVLSPKVNTVSRALVLAGLPPKAAYQQASEAIVTNSVIVNGHAVPGAANLDPKFEANAEEWLDAQYGDDGEMWTLYPLPDQNGIFVPLHKTSMVLGEPISAADIKQFGDRGLDARAAELTANERSDRLAELLDRREQYTRSLIGDKALAFGTVTPSAEVSSELVGRDYKHKRLRTIASRLEFVERQIKALEAVSSAPDDAAGE